MIEVAEGELARPGPVVGFDVPEAEPLCDEQAERGEAEDEACRDEEWPGLRLHLVVPPT